MCISKVLDLAGGGFFSSIGLTNLAYRMTEERKAVTKQIGLFGKHPKKKGGWVDGGT